MKKKLLLSHKTNQKKKFNIKKALRTRFGKGAWLDFSEKVESASKRDIYSKKGKLWLKSSLEKGLQNTKFGFRLAQG